MTAPRKSAGRGFDKSNVGLGSIPRPIFLLKLQPESDCPVETTRQLRFAIKRLLRTYGLRLLDIREELS
jgi:hypothetical protein